MLEQESPSPGVDYSTTVLKGAYAGDSANLTPKDGIGYSPMSIQQLFRDALIGASQRRLSAIFGTDQVERHKVERFFVSQVAETLPDHGNGS